MKRLAFYGGSFNPPTIAHEAIVDHLVLQDCFAKVILKPCGTRKDKPELNQSLSSRQQKIIDQLERDCQHFHLDLSAMAMPMIPTVEEWKNLKNRFSDYQIDFVAGTDLFIQEDDGRCQIQKWVDGEYLYQNAHFYIYPRPAEGTYLKPPQCTEVTNFKPINISSSELRALSKS